MAVTPEPIARVADLAGLAETLADQDGVIGRHQVLAHGFTQNDIRRRLRRREWVLVHPGVYVDHTGRLTWKQRAWAAVLVAWPAALAGESALRAASGPGRAPRPGMPEDAPIVVAIDRRRTIKSVDGVVFRPTARITARVQWNTSPPRMRLEEALLDLASITTDRETPISLLSDAVQARLTTAERLIDSLTARPRITRRIYLMAILTDVRDGTCSVLEHAYLHQIEQRHGLPLGTRQAPFEAPRRGFRDVDYTPWPLLVELDGRIGHSRSRDRDRDLERDLDALVLQQARTVRLGWGQVLDRPCETARKIAHLLTAAGWAGTFTPCPACPPGPAPGALA